MESVAGRPVVPRVSAPWSSTSPGAGSGAELADWLEASGVPHVVYSSCNAESLARHLDRMPSLQPVEARVLDMFPHTTHYEVLVQLSH